MRATLLIVVILTVIIFIEFAGSCKVVYGLRCNINFLIIFQLALFHQVTTDHFGIFFVQKFVWVGLCKVRILITGPQGVAVFIFKDGGSRFSEYQRLHTSICGLLTGSIAGLTLTMPMSD